MLTPEHLSALRAKAQAATSGPWKPDYRQMYVFDEAEVNICCQIRGYGDMAYTHSDAAREAQMRANNAFIAAANPATVMRLLDVINTLAIWLSYSNDCPMPDCHPCEYRSGSGCDANTNKAKSCWIQAAEEVTNDDPRTNR